MNIGLLREEGCFSPHKSLNYKTPFDMIKTET
jgi:hypothetical protein